MVSHHSPAVQGATWLLRDEAATLDFGAKLARTLRPGLRVYIKGDLGSGKTTLVRGILRGLGYTEKVKSPSYTLVELYEVSSLYLYHFDFYRFADPEEWEDAGFREYFDEQSVCLVEWPEKAGELLPKPDVEVGLRVEEDGRRIGLSAGTEAGRQCLDALKKMT